MTRITSWVMINFLASVSFSVGKLFPPDDGYINCSSVRCLKVVHNAVLTLACFPFDWIDAIIIEKKVMVEKRQSSVGSAAQVQPDLQSDRTRYDCVLKFRKCWFESVIFSTIYWIQMPRDPGRLYWLWWRSCLKLC